MGRSGARCSSWAAGSWSCRDVPPSRQGPAWRCGCRCATWPRRDRSSADAALGSYGSRGGSRGDCWRCGSPTRTGCASASWRYRPSIRFAAVTDWCGASCRGAAQVEIEEYIGAHVVADRVLVPDGPAQQVLQPVRAVVTGVLSDPPAVLARQIQKQPTHQRPGAPAWFHPGRTGVRPDPVTPPALAAIGQGLCPIRRPPAGPRSGRRTTPSRCRPAGTGRATGARSGRTASRCGRRRGR
jgi:hypothetical protein